MNTYALIAGIIALLATLGHLTIGNQSYYKPLGKSDIDITVKTIFKALFHYITGFQILSSFILIMIGIRGNGCNFEPLLVLGFIAANYIFWMIAQLVIAIKSPIKGAATKLFQWIFWLLIAVFTILAFMHSWNYINEWV